MHSHCLFAARCYCETFDVALRYVCVKPLRIREDLGPWYYCETFDVALRILYIYIKPLRIREDLGCRYHSGEPDVKLDQQQQEREALGACVQVTDA